MRVKLGSIKNQSPDISIVADRLNGRPVRAMMPMPLPRAIRGQYVHKLVHRLDFDIRLIPCHCLEHCEPRALGGRWHHLARPILNRMEWGMRGAFLVGPSFNGLEGTLVAEAWGAIYYVSRSDWANFSPYHPIFNGGVFVRYQRGGVLVPSEEDRVV